MDEVVKDDEFKYAEETQDESGHGMEQRRRSNYEKAQFNAWQEGLIEHYIIVRRKGQFAGCASAVFVGKKKKKIKQM